MARGRNPGDVRRVAIVSNPRVDGGYAKRLVKALGDGGVEVSEIREQGEPDGATRPDLVFVLGGDGTMLRATRLYPGRVLLGVNLGTVGFMSGMQPEDLEAGVEKVLAGQYHVQEYRMLEVRFDDGEVRHAVNDAVLLKPRPHQITAVDLSVSDEFLVHLQCDGFIAATPLGSTAYALSAGGPIVSGDTPCFVVVAIAPHSLVARPLVLGEDQVVRLDLVERESLISLDGDEPRRLPVGSSVHIGLSAESVRIGRTDGWSWWRAVRRTFL